MSSVIVPKLALYHYPSCYYCGTVRQALQHYGIEAELRDIHRVVLAHECGEIGDRIGGIRVQTIGQRRVELLIEEFGVARRGTLELKSVTQKGTS